VRVHGSHLQVGISSGGPALIDALIVRSGAAARCRGTTYLRTYIALKRSKVVGVPPTETHLPTHNELEFGAPPGHLGAIRSARKCDAAQAPRFQP
jgi:hypothetical protein